jgi:hypothetical protein
MTNRPRRLLATLICAAPAAAQPVVRIESKSEPVPIEIALHDLHDAYSGTTADLVHVRFRTPAGAERSDELVVRLHATPAGLQRALLEMGPLRLFAGGGSVVLVNNNVPGKYVQRDYTGPLTAAALADLTPPLIAPELPLALGEAFTAPTPYTAGVTWAAAAIDTSIRGRFLKLSGSTPASQVVVSANPDTGRLARLTAALQSGDGASTLDLAIRPVQPGDPDSWSINTAGRTRVKSLADLKPSSAPPAGAVQPGQPVPDLVFSNPDHSKWSIHTALAATPTPPPLALILFRSPAIPEQGADAFRGAVAARAALQSLTDRYTPAAAVVVELADFTPAKWEDAQRAWSAAAAPSKPAAPLLWAPSAAQTIDRFAPGAQSLLIVVNPDRTLRAAIRLDGRSSDPAGLTQEIRSALSGPH